MPSLAELAGLQNGLLGTIYGRADALKRTLADLAQNPMGLLGQRTGRMEDTERGLLGLLSPQGSPEQQRWSDTTANMAPGLLGIVSPAKARTLNINPSLPAAPEFAQAVANTPGASLASDGLLMRVMRNQMPEQAQQESVRGGVFYLPEGAAQGKHYSTGKNGYGGPERIAGETLVQNPLLAKGGTGGTAPKTAYDSLLGKGSYENMRDDALKTLGYPRTDPAKVEEFLAQYAPEMSGLSDHIIQNSGKGNQLPYALQEAAVASAVRRAGHDAVLGYSKGKNGPFLSELFDVRESHYPDKFGWSRVWPDLEP